MRYRYRYSIDIKREQVSSDVDASYTISGHVNAGLWSDAVQRAMDANQINADAVENIYMVRDGIPDALPLEQS